MSETTATGTTAASMSDRPTMEMDVQDRYPWLLLFQTFRIAISPAMLLIAAAGALVGVIGWQLCGAIFLDQDLLASTPGLQADADYFSAFPGERRIGNCPVGCYEYPPGKHVAEVLGAWPEDPLLAMPYRMVRPFVQLGRSGSWAALSYYFFGAAWTLSVWALFGCALTRIAVVRLAHDEYVDFLSALRVGAKRFGQHVAAMLMPLCGVFLLSLPLAVLGFFMRWNPAAALGGILWIVTVPVAIVMSLFVLGWLFGGSCVGFWQGVVRTLASAYAYSFFWAATAAVYLLMRFDIDAVEVDEVFDHEDGRGGFGVSLYLNRDTDLG